jgi:hypothetical protein
VVIMRREGYYDYEDRVAVKGGDEAVVHSTMKPIDTGPSAADLGRRQKNLTSHAARVAPKGNSTIDIAGGYPYFATVKFNVGAGKLGGAFGFDVGLLFRTFLARSDLAVTSRVNLVDVYPFSVGVFGQAGGGSNFVDDSQRSTYFFDAGLAASLTGLGAVSITGRAYANLYRDRHCPALNAAGNAYDDADADGVELCDEYLNGTIDPALKTRIDEQLLDGDGAIFDAEYGWRVLTSLIIEIAIKQRWNLYLLVEWAPFQEERAVFTDAFTSPLLEEDPISYGQLGATYKF